MATTAETGPIIDDDRLSDLPDDLLHLILSFLDAKIAVQTSVLSSRWRYLWTSLPFLNFQRQGFYRSDNPEREYVLRTIATFESFVRQFLSHRDASTRVSQLKIYCSVDYAGECEFPVGFPGDGSLAEAIIDYVHSMGIQHLSIAAFDVVGNLANLSYCHSLTTLELAGLVLENPKFDSATITNLRLEGCVFSNCGHTFDPFKGCVNLRSLYVIACYSMSRIKIKKFKITAPQLRDLTLEEMALATFHPDLELVLSTPMLTSFQHIGSDLIEFSTNVDLPFLEELYMEISFFSERNLQSVCRMIKVFEVMSNAKFVTVDPFFIAAIMKIPGILDHRPSPFASLQSLQSTESSFPLHPNFVAYAGSPVIRSF